MKNLVLIVTLLLLQAGISLPQGAFAQEPVGEVPIGEYNPDEDETIKNHEPLEQGLIAFADWTNSIFKKIKPEGYTDGPFSSFFTFLADLVLLMLFHLLYSKLIFRRRRRRADRNKLLARYSTLLIAFAVVVWLILIKDSFIWGALFVVPAFFICAMSVGIMGNHLCPHCCKYNKIVRNERPQQHFAVELYGEKTHHAQYLTPDTKITREMVPEGGFKLYQVQRIHIDNRCPECGAQWKTEEWKRLKELAL